MRHRDTTQTVCWIKSWRGVLQDHFVTSSRVRDRFHVRSHINSYFHVGFKIITDQSRLSVQRGVPLVTVPLWWMDHRCFLDSLNLQWPRLRCCSSAVPGWLQFQAVHTLTWCKVRPEVRWAAAQGRASKRTVLETPVSRGTLRQQLRHRVDCPDCPDCPASSAVQSHYVLLQIDKTSTANWRFLLFEMNTNLKMKRKTQVMIHPFLSAGGVCMK